jgi:hypothetical protein
MTRLTFSAGAHRYWLTPETGGKKQPIKSVTTCLKVLAKDALVQWAANTAADYAIDSWDSLAAMDLSQRRTMIAKAPSRARDTAAAKGTQIHAWADQLLQGQPVEIPDEYTAQVEGFAKWWEASGFTKIRAESMVWSEDDELGGIGYAGTFDLLAEHPRHGLTLIDLKTGKGIYSEFAVQLAAYAAAENHVIDGQDRTPRPIRTLAAVHIRPDGTTMHLLDREQRLLAHERWDIIRSLNSVPEPVFAENIA